MNQELLDRILSSPELPSLPAIALEVIELVHQPEADMRKIAATIQHDPALAGKILKTVNSSFYGQSYTISTLTQALNVLGTTCVKTLALGFSLVANLQRTDNGRGGEHVTFWKRSLYTALAAQCFARQVELPHQEEAFLAGLMHDLGLLALQLTLGEDYQRLLRDAGADHPRLVSLERERLEIDHACVGGAMAEHWCLPPILVAPIRFHAAPEEADAPHRQLVKCVALGRQAADVFIAGDDGGAPPATAAEAADTAAASDLVAVDDAGAGPDRPAGEALSGFYDEAERWFGLTRDQAQPLLYEIHEATRQMQYLFDLPVTDQRTADDIVARANQALLELSLQTAQQTHQLERQNRELTHTASTDPLTAVANRGRFDAFLDAAFNAAAQGAGPVSVLFLDIDHFKSFNDTYGHATGDRVLTALATLLHGLMPESALVARYGGEEFAVVLPDTDRRTAAELAESACRKIAVSPVRSDEGKSLSVTASIGVATFDPHVFTSAAHLVKAADKGVYAAKAAGRNGVRVFVPRRQPRTEVCV